MRLAMTELDGLADVLAPDTAAAWPHVAACRPDGSVLMGGTALAVHLRHRVSRDLDLFCHEGLDVGRVQADLSARGAFVRTSPADDRTLNGLFGETKVQFLAVDQHQIREPVMVAGMPVGSVEDILATKLKVVGDRGELRDYYDIMRIEQDAQLSVEYGLLLYQERYAVAADHETVLHIVRSLGYLDDVDDDPLLAQWAGDGVREIVAAYWRSRQPEILTSLDTQAESPPGRELDVDLAAAVAQERLSVVSERRACGRIVRSTGLPCRLTPGHRGHCRSR